MLADDVAWALPQLRAEAEARMLSTCVVRRMTGRAVQNEDTGLETPTWTAVYTGRMRLGGSRNAATTRTESIAGVDVQVALRIAHFPADTDGLLDGDLIDITGGENTGLVLRIAETAWQDQATARRYPVESADRPGEW